MQTIATGRFTDLHAAPTDNVVEVIGKSTLGPAAARVRYVRSGTVSTIMRDQMEPIVRYHDPKPFYVLTRTYNADGDCDKGEFRFATRAQQQAFIARTTRAVTAFN